MLPVYKMVDTCAAEFEAADAVLLLHLRRRERGAAAARQEGAGHRQRPDPHRPGIEFDYSAVHAAWACKEAGVAAIMANSNPETVSTDFDTATGSTSSRWTRRRARHPGQRGANGSRPANGAGSIVQFGGQTAVNLAEPLARANRAHPRLQRRRDRPRRRPAPLRGPAAAPRHPAAAGRRRPHRRRGAGDGPAHRLPGAGAAELRAGRARHGDRPERHDLIRYVRDAATDLARQAGADRQVPGGHRGRGRRDLRRRRTCSSRASWSTSSAPASTPATHGGLPRRST